LEDIPADIMNVINHALLIISWQENLPSEEIPKYWMWHLDWEIEEWFKKVKIERDIKYGTEQQQASQKLWKGEFADHSDSRQSDQPSNSSLCGPNCK